MINAVQNRGFNLSQPRFTGETPDALAQKFATTSETKRNTLLPNIHHETVQPPEIGKAFRNFIGYVALLASSLGAAFGGYQVLQHYRSQVLTEEQVTAENNMLRYQAEVSPKAQPLIDWDDNTHITPDTKVVAIQDMDRLYHLEEGFFSGFTRLLRQSQDLNDQSLAAKLAAQPAVFDLKTQQTAENLIKYLKAQDAKKEALNIDAYLAQQPEFANHSLRERENLAAHVAQTWNENRQPAAEIENLVKVSLFSRLAGLGMNDVLAIDSQEQLIAFFEKGMQNPAVYSQLSSQERELMTTRGKEYLKSLDYQAHTPANGWHLAAAIALLAGGAIGGIWGVSTGYSSVQGIMQKRRERFELLTSEKPTLIVKVPQENRGKITGLTIQLENKLNSLWTLRQQAIKADPEVSGFFKAVYGRSSRSQDPATPNADTLSKWYKSQAQTYFLKTEKRKEVSEEEFLAKALELVEQDLENYEYLPEFAFDETDAIPRLIAEEMHDLTQDKFNQVIARQDADIFNSLKLEINQRILMQATRQQLNTMEEKTRKWAEGLPTPELGQEQTEQSQAFKEKVLSQRQQMLDQIIANRVTLQKNRQQWHLLWMQAQQTADSRKILGDLHRSIIKANLNQEESDQAMKTLALDVRVKDKALTRQISNLTEDGNQVAKTLEAARNQRKTD